MKFNPKIHHRRSIRLRGYDYSQKGAYFITIVTHHRRYLFGEIQCDQMILSPVGQIAVEEWLNLRVRWPHLDLGAFQVMPDHIHGIIVITDKVHASEAPTIGSIVGAYKSRVATQSLKWFVARYPNKRLGKFWHRDYYEHIIRNERAYRAISQYIFNNPANWKKRRFSHWNPPANPF